MIKISSAPLSRLRSSQHLFLMTEFARLVLEHDPKKLDLEILLPELQQAIAVEQVAVKAEMGSPLTQTINGLIILREKYYKAILKLIDNGLDHFDPTVVEAAKKLERLTNKYSNILGKTKTEKITDFGELCNELQKPESVAAVAKISAAEWALKVFETNTEAIRLINQRDAEEAARPEGNVHDARLAVDPIYISMVDRVNASVILKGEAGLKEFISQLNVKINNIKNTMAQQEGAKKKDAPADDTTK